MCGAYLAQDPGVPDDDDGVFGPGEGDVEPPGVGEEPDPLVLVGPDAGDDDDVLLSALEGVHAGDLHVLVELGVEGSLVLHVGDEERPLPLVGGDDPDLVGLDPRPDEQGCQFLHVGRFPSVQVGGAVGSDLLLTRTAKRLHIG